MSNLHSTCPAYELLGSRVQDVHDSARVQVAESDFFLKDTNCGSTHPHLKMAFHAHHNHASANFTDAAVQVGCFFFPSVICSLFCFCTFALFLCKGKSSRNNNQTSTNNPSCASFISSARWSFDLFRRFLSIRRRACCKVRSNLLCRKRSRLSHFKL